LRILFQLSLRCGVGLQILLQIRMAFHVLLVIQERWILGDLLPDVRVATQKLPEACRFAALGVAIEAAVVSTKVLLPVEALFLAHECVRVLTEFLAHSRMLLQVTLQFRVFGDEFLVIHERRILAQLLGSLGMTVEEAVHAG
jgi:hypothetical protein